MFGTAGEYFHPNRRLRLFRTPYQRVLRCHPAAKYNGTWLRVDAGHRDFDTGRS